MEQLEKEIIDVLKEKYPYSSSTLNVDELKSTTLPALLETFLKLELTDKDIADTKEKQKSKMSADKVEEYGNLLLAARNEQSLEKKKEKLVS